MRCIKIFLASSYELCADRIRIGDMIRCLNNNSSADLADVHISVFMWEDASGYVISGGQQESQL